MTNKERMDCIAALREARGLIEAGTLNHICYAINSIHAEIEIKCRLKRWIVKQLNGSSTLTQWLFIRGYKDAYSNREKLRSTRLAWIDAMIEELKR